MPASPHPPGFDRALTFPLVDALWGRRSRRFAVGASLSQGSLAYTSRHPPLPLTTLERALVLSASAGVTGWHNLIMRDAPALPSYPASAAGRTFPSAAGWQTSEIFFTDDEGVYFFATRDAPPLVAHTPTGDLDLDRTLAAHEARIRQLAAGRLHLPPRDPHMDGHNAWCANVPGSLLIFPVADLAQHLIAVLCYMVENHACIYDNIHNERIPGMERFRDLVDVENPAPLTEIEQGVLTMATAELATCCYAGMLMLQAMGLGGWMFTGINWLSVLGASGDPSVPGLGFTYAADPRWPIPNPTGLAGVFEGYSPPHFPEMRVAVDAFVRRKFGPGGPFHPATPGPWQESAAVRSSVGEYNMEFKDCVAHMAQYIFDRFGKFPATVPTVFMKTVLQAHHLDLEFYDHHFAPGAYLSTHANHMANWHPAAEPD